MRLRRAEMVALGLVLLSFAVSVYFYPQMPERMASHWNAAGEVDGYQPKLQALFLMPLVLFGMALLFWAIPRIDPLKANIEQFRNYYDGLVILLLVFMLCVHLQTILWNVGFQISPNATFPLGLGLLYYYIGILLEHAKRNWFVGIRTPWTLSSDRVWEKTHRIGGKLFRVAGAAAFLGVFFHSLAVLFVLVPVILVAFYTVVYSYIEYQREMR